MYRLNKVIDDKKIILFGVGKTDSVYKKFIMDEFGDRVKYFIDNNICTRYTYKTYSFNVYPVSKIIEEDSQKYFCLIMTQTENVKREMKEQLESLGLKEKDNFDFIQNYEDDIIKYKISEIETKPKHLVMELSSYCNLKCEFCNFHGFENINVQRKNFLTWEILKEMVSQIKQNNTIKRITSYHSGEELLHLQWYEMIQYILDETQIEEFVISTNGMLLNDENISKFARLRGKKIKLFISLSGNNIYECESIRKNLVYDIVKKNILNAYEKLLGKVEIIINCDYMIDEAYFNSIEKNYNNIVFQVPDYIKKDFPMIQCNAYPTLLYNPDIMSEQLKEFCEPMRVINRKSFCSNIFDLICIDSTGYVLNCSCNGGYERLGNILEKDMFEIWEKSDFMIKSREVMKKEYKSPKWCENCAYQLNGEFYMLVKKKEFEQDK